MSGRTHHKPRGGVSFRVLLLLFFAVDAVLAIGAHHYLHSLNDLAVSSIGHAPISQELLAVREVERVAQAGSWDAMEKARAEQALFFVKSEKTPSRGVALYFFPETLPEKSLEREFAFEELQPALTELRRAYEKRELPKSKQAYRTLRERVLNYEQGSSDEPTSVSEEARSFLATYQVYSGVTDRLPSSTADLPTPAAPTEPSEDLKEPAPDPGLNLEVDEE
ncbi:MAG: hypothetical protein ACXWP5_15835 [Bdellovibrionota bacterium]